MKTPSRLPALVLLAVALAIRPLAAAPRIAFAEPDPAMTLPVPLRTVEPQAVPRDFVDSTVEVVMTIDTEGRPHDLAAGRGVSETLAKRLLPAMARWRFSPVRQAGRPVPLRVVLPVKLVCND